jgi:hypothetical protein
MAAPTQPVQLTDAEIQSQVRRNYQLCRYIFNCAFAWLIVAVAVGMADGSLSSEPPAVSTTVLYAVGAGIFSVAFTVTLALYRCPVCDKYIHRFRPNKLLCSTCGAHIYASWPPR